jgi:hypothetical protein
VLTVVGIFGSFVKIPIPLMIMKQFVVRGSLVGELPELVGLSWNGAIQAIPTAFRPVAQIKDALDTLRAGHRRGRIHAAASRAAPPLISSIPLATGANASRGSAISPKKDMPTIAWESENIWQEFLPLRPCKLAI